MKNTGPPRVGWRKSTYSFSYGNCVEVAGTGTLIAVRDSQDQDGPQLAFAPEQWAAFAAVVKAPEQQANDVHRLLSVLGGEPAHVFGSSGGAVVGLALVTAHPGQVRTLVAHEPPVIELLPDREQVRAQIQDIYDTYRADGADKAMAEFMAHAGLGEAPGLEVGAPRWEPSPEQVATMRAATDTFLAHLLRPTTHYRPDVEALRAAPARIVVAAGATSKGQLAHRSAVTLADRLGTPVVESGLRWRELDRDGGIRAEQV